MKACFKHVIFKIILWKYSKSSVFPKMDNTSSLNCRTRPCRGIAVTIISTQTDRKRSFHWEENPLILYNQFLLSNLWHSCLGNQLSNMWLVSCSLMQVGSAGTLQVAKMHLLGFPVASKCQLDPRSQDLFNRTNRDLLLVNYFPQT